MTEVFAQITPGQMRAGRAFLRWTAQDLAAKAGIGAATIQRAEAADSAPKMTRANMEAVRRALEAAGIRFTPDGGVVPAPGSDAAE